MAKFVGKNGKPLTGAALAAKQASVKKAAAAQAAVAAAALANTQAPAAAATGNPPASQTATAGSPASSAPATKAVPTNIWWEFGFKWLRFAAIIALIFFGGRWAIKQIWPNLGQPATVAVSTGGAQPTPMTVDPSLTGNVIDVTSEVVTNRFGVTILTTNKTVTKQIVVPTTGTNGANGGVTINFAPVIQTSSGGGSNLNGNNGNAPTCTTNTPSRGGTTSVAPALPNFLGNTENWDGANPATGELLPCIQLRAGQVGKVRLPKKTDAGDLIRLVDIQTEGGRDVTYYFELRSGKVLNLEEVRAQAARQINLDVKNVFVVNGDNIPAKVLFTWTLMKPVGSNG